MDYRKTNFSSLVAVQQYKIAARKSDRIDKFLKRSMPTGSSRFFRGMYRGKLPCTTRKRGGFVGRKGNTGFSLGI